MSQDISFNCAWIANKAEIDDWLEVVNQDAADQACVAYLQSAPASGKSTTLLKYLMNRADAWPDPEACFVYVAPHEAQLRYVLDHIIPSLPEQVKSRLSIKFRETFPLKITTYEDFVRWDSMFDQECFPKKTIVVAEVELRPSVMGEIFFARLIQRLRVKSGTKAPVHGIFLLSSHRCLRTVRAFDGLTTRGGVRDIKVEAPDVPLRIKTIDDEVFFEVIVENIQRIHGLGVKGKYVVVSQRHHGGIFHVSNKIGLKVGEINHQHLCADQTNEVTNYDVLLVDPEADMSVAVPDLRLLAVDCRVKATVIDPGTGHMVSVDKLMNEFEQNRFFSVALKLAPQELKTISIISNLTESMNVTRGLDAKIQLAARSHTGQAGILQRGYHHLLLEAVDQMNKIEPNPTHSYSGDGRLAYILYLDTYQTALMISGINRSRRFPL
ncbi:hypothetical protein F5B19DRAFT_502213 [Rostrohypoxylon terebratum]|nr:hypothetical protein F5B19DRAFT_502213 [Rostrohypoxylon terebratum]